MSLPQLQTAVKEPVTETLSQTELFSLLNSLSFAQWVNQAVLYRHLIFTAIKSFIVQLQKCLLKIINMLPHSVGAPQNAGPTFGCVTFRPTQQGFFKGR